MQQVSLKMNVDEAQALLELVDNQLFRMKFIDPKLPGHRANPDRLRLATAAVNRLKEAFRNAKGIKIRGAA